MFYRFTFVLLASFWLTMTYFLWRSEYIGHRQVGSDVPLELVWHKILTAPDASPLRILHNGKKVGDCRWTSNVGQDPTAAKALTDDAPPEGMVEKPANYVLDFQGSMTTPEIPGFHFNSEIKLSTNGKWQDFHARVGVRSVTWEIFSQASQESIRLAMQNKEGVRFDHSFTFADLQNPQVLMREFDIPALGLLGMLSPLPQPKTSNSLSLGLQWEARDDWITIGHTSVPAYRVEAVALERYRMIVVVSWVGEIIRVELPDGWELLNDNLISL